MKMREEIIQANTDTGAARGLALAAVMQAIPPFVWASGLILLAVFIALAVGFHLHDMPAAIDKALTWLFWGVVLVIVLVFVRLLVKAHAIYHDVVTKFYERRIASATAQRQTAMARKAELQNDELEARIALVREMPAIVQYAIQAGHNITVDNKGTVQVQNWMSNMHQLGGPAPALQIGGPGADFVPPPYKLSDEFQRFTPSKDGILLAKGRELITVPIGETLCHTTFTGNTDAGKTNDERTLLIQLLFLEQIVFLCDRNYQRYRLDKKNAGVVYDYSHIESQLAYPPAVATLEAVKVLQYLVAELENRRERRRKALVQFPDIYLFMDELPAFCAEDNSIMTYVGRLVREARQYGIFFIGAAQDLLNDTMQAKSGAYRDNFLTNYYGGGDATTARLVLNLAKGETIDETGLGKQGVKYLRAKGADIEHAKVRTAYADNEATLMLLEGRPPVQQLERLFEGEVVDAGRRDTGELAGSELDGDLLTVYEAFQELQSQGVKPSARKVEDITGIDKDKANGLLNRLADMRYITR